MSPEINIEKNFIKLITKYLNKRTNQKFIDKYQFLNFMLFIILEDISHMSSHLKFIPIINILLNTYVNVNAKMRFGKTPLTMSARYGHEEILKATW